MTTGCLAAMRGSRGPVGGTAPKWCRKITGTPAWHRAPVDKRVHTLMRSSLGASWYVADVAGLSLGRRLAQPLLISCLPTLYIG